MFSDFTWWHIAYLLITTHITIVTVTVYLHRGLAHRSLSCSKPLEHFFRFWCWLTTGQNPREWAAVHRKHHAFCEKPEDPHSPKIYGIWTVLFKGLMLYKKEANNPETIKRYGHMTPDDKINDFYTKYSKSGMTALGIIQVLIFGWHGLWMIGLQLAWIPFWAAGVVNGVGHHKGYRNFNTTDSSTNISPWGIIIGGEELHNNHHAYATSAKLSFKWYEFDIGWLWITIFKFFGLLKVNKVHKLPQITNQPIFCLDTILTNKSYVLKMFYKKTKGEVLSIIKKLKSEDSELKQVSTKELNFIFYHNSDNSLPLTEKQKTLLQKLLQHKILSYIYSKKEDLLNFWQSKTYNAQQLKDYLISWVNSVIDFSKNHNHQYYYLENFAIQLSKLKTI